MSPNELTWLATQAQKYKTIVEFGSFHGRSTRALADNISDEGTIWAVDTWNGDYIDESGDALERVDTYVLPQFRANLQDHIDFGRVIPVRNFSYAFNLPILVDMVFIDSDHRYETVKKDIKKALLLLKSGGILSGHDYNHPLWSGVSKAVNELSKSFETCEMIWYTQKS